jgi:hypothetical protein
MVLPDGQELKAELFEVVGSTVNKEKNYTLKYYATLLVTPGENWVAVKGYQKLTNGKVTEMEESLNEPVPFFAQSPASSALQHNNVTDGGVSAGAGPFRKSNETDNEKAPNPTFMPIGLQPINPPGTYDVSFWTSIRNATDSLSYGNYSKFMDYLFCNGELPFNSKEDEKPFRHRLKEANSRLQLPFNNVDAYRALKVATEAFVMANLSVAGEPDPAFADDFKNYKRKLEEEGPSGGKEVLSVIPYLAIIRQQMQDVDIKFHLFEDALDKYVHNNDRLADHCYGLIKQKLQYPCFLELIWNYWHEESMMVQGIGTISRRFQNIRGEGAIDPLANLEIGPLRSLNNLLWGYIQDEQHRLTVRRRAYEYNHHYGITLQGKAVTSLRPADSRSKFIEAFHTLLNLCVKFYKQYDDTTVVADGFPVMNALKEVHLILSEGAHNQYGDLPSTSRIEMLMQQYILARPEFREFLLSRQMVAYPEPWMDRVAALNQMHNWTRTSVLHYRDLGVFGEQIILSIRFGAWSNVFNRDQAANWAIFWRPQIQNYIHAYRAVTGADLSREDGVVDVQQPSVHLVRRLKEQNLSKIPARLVK